MSADSKDIEKSDAAPVPAQTEYRLIGPSDSGEVSDLLAGLSGKDAKHRLQALIAEWLRMENLVVLAGAGTSVTSGGKTMANLERAVLETVNATKDLPAGAAAVIKAQKKGDTWLADRVYSGVPASMLGLAQVIEVGPMSGLSNVNAWLEQRGLPTDKALQDRIFGLAKKSSRILTDAEITAEVESYRSAARA